MRLRTIQVAAFAAALICSGLTGGSAQADHDTRFVIVNGARLSPAQVLSAERAIGYRLPSGYYWYNEASGYWGVIGGPPLGRITATNPRRGGGGQYPILIDPSGGCEAGSCVNILD